MDHHDSRGAPPRQPSWWRSPRAWWTSRTPVQRVEIYTEQILYWLGAIAPLLLLMVTQGSTRPGWLVALLVAASAGQGVAAFLVLRAGLQVRRRGEALRALVALGTTTAVVLALAAAVPGGADLAASPRQAVVVYTMIFSPAAVCVVYRRCGWLVPLATGVVVGGSASLSGAAGGLSLRVGLAGAVASTFIVMTLRLSVWLLDVVRQLADAQTDRARLAVAEERLRFARDLHDVVGRDLSAIALKSEVVARLAERGRPEAVAEALSVRELAQSSLAEVRAVVRGHRRADLATELSGARALLSSAGVACEVRVDDGSAERLPTAAQEALAWAVREAVTNVVRHARARTCWVTLSVVDGVAVLVVRNDGVDGVGPLVAGAGLNGLRERLEVRGGDLQVRCERGRVALTATVPIAGRVPADTGREPAGVSA